MSSASRAAALSSRQRWRAPSGRPARCTPAKLPAPGQPEYAVGATTEDGTTVRGPDADRPLADPGTRAALRRGDPRGGTRRVTSNAPTGRCPTSPAATWCASTTAGPPGSPRPRRRSDFVPTARIRSCSRCRRVPPALPAPWNSRGRGAMACALRVVRRRRAWYREFRQVTDAEVLERYAALIVPPPDGQPTVASAVVSYEQTISDVVTVVEAAGAAIMVVGALLAFAGRRPPGEPGADPARGVRACVTTSGAASCSASRCSSWATSSVRSSSTRPSRASPSSA